MAGSYYQSPLGWIKVSGDESGVNEVAFVEEPAETNIHLPQPVMDCIDQLEEYFAGERKHFALPLTPKGTEFQLNVWEELLKIPFGKTMSYGEIARLLRNHGSVRAVGAANGANPVAIVIPCHRVRGSDGSLTGYAGGLWRKKWLIEFESGSISQTLFKTQKPK